MVGLMSTVFCFFFQSIINESQNLCWMKCLLPCIKRRCLCHKSQEISYERFQVLSPQVIACNPFSNHLGWTFSSSTWLSKPPSFSQKRNSSVPKLGETAGGKVSSTIPILQKGLRHGRSSKPLVFFHWEIGDSNQPPKNETKFSKLRNWRFINP